MIAIIIGPLILGLVAGAIVGYIAGVDDTRARSRGDRL
jgi:hypothetical protein